MKLFQTIRGYFAVMGFEPAQQSKNHSLNLADLVILTILVQFSVAITAFIFCDAKSFKEVADSFYPAASAISATLNLITIICNAPNLFKLIDGYENAIQSRLENPVSKRIYEEANQQIEKWSELLNTMMRKLTVPCLVLPKFVISFVTYIVTDLGNDALQLQYPMRFPFAWQNPTGYSIALAEQYISWLCIAHVAFTHTEFISASCWIFISIAKDIDQALNAIFEIAKSETDRSEFLDRLTQLIKLHSQAKQFACDFSRTYQYNLLIFFVWSNACICGALLMIQMEISQHTINRMVLVFLVCAMFWSFGFILFFCEFGQRVSDAFDDIHDTITQSEWYMFPLKTQRLLPVMMIVTKQQVSIQIFGSMTCIREMFKKVVNAGFSYFAMLRQFGN